jgi:hypothetical protein
MMFFQRMVPVLCIISCLRGSPFSPLSSFGAPPPKLVTRMPTILTASRGPSKMFAHNSPQRQKIKQQPCNLTPNSPCPSNSVRLPEPLMKMSNAVVCAEIKSDVVIATHSEDSNASQSCEGCPHGVGLLLLPLQKMTNNEPVARKMRVSPLPSSAPELVINKFVARKASLFPLQSSAQESPRQTGRTGSSRSMLHLHRSRRGDTAAEL